MEREKDERLRCPDRQMVSLAVSRGLPLHTPLHLPLPISSLSVTHGTPTSTPSLFAVLLPLLALTLCSHPSMLVCFVGCMSSVRCNPNWLVHCGVCVGVKPVKWCPPLSLPFSHISPLSVFIGKAAASRKGQQALGSLQGAVRVKSPQKRYLAAIYSH